MLVAYYTTFSMLWLWYNVQAHQNTMPCIQSCREEVFLDETLFLHAHRVSCFKETHLETS